MGETPMQLTGKMPVLLLTIAITGIVLKLVLVPASANRGTRVRLHAVVSNLFYDCRNTLITNQALTPGQPLPLDSYRIGRSGPATR